MDYAHPEYLIETGWLAEHLEDPLLRLFDVTGMLTGKLVNLARERAYDAGHIPGAVFLDVAAARGDLSDPEGPLPWSWPSAAQVERTMGALGVDNASRVVLYAATPRPGIDNGAMWATRAWWILHHFGLSAAILNGGWEKWRAEGRPVSTTPGGYPPSILQARPDGDRAMAGKEDVLAALEDPAGCVVDALSADSYAGAASVTYGPRKGHIRGAGNVPMRRLLDETTGTFLPADELAAVLRDAGALEARRTITYCGGGIAATTVAFGLALLGRDNVSVYNNSLMEWSADETLPMEDPSAARG